ncbi:hypothetical protein EH31_08335 [Erythrobacter longus]|uniref:Uncharacterized protein n=1 Tax=Erythrobacter longus TaxID=1044 RepID=A0A074MBF6_ERYLO|nr:hypothetical protein EH31_08335 [Erythrobacter longus]
MRARTVLASYALACLIGTATIFVVFLLDSLRENAPSLQPGSAWIKDLTYIAMWAALISLPLGLPTIIATEKLRKGPLWGFLLLAILHTAIILLYFVLTNDRRLPVFWSFYAMISWPFCAGWISYWLAAWRCFPPKHLKTQS